MPVSIHAKIGLALRPLMDKNGFSGTRLIGYEHNWKDAASYPVQLVRIFLTSRCWTVCDVVLSLRWIKPVAHSQVSVFRPLFTHPSDYHAYSNFRWHFTATAAPSAKWTLSTRNIRPKRYILLNVLACLGLTGGPISNGIWTISSSLELRIMHVRG